MLGQVATLGRFKGIAELPDSISGAFPAGSSRGPTTCTSSLLLTRKLRVVVDWTVALFFRRDIVELSMLGHPRTLKELTTSAATSAPAFRDWRAVEHAREEVAVALRHGRARPPS